MIIREMIPEDWGRVFEIYKQGISSGKTTFSTNYPSWEEWDAEHNKCCRFVALYNNEIAGFTAVSPVSKKPHYFGVVEVSIFTVNVASGRLVIGSVSQRIDLEIGRIQHLWNIDFLMKL